LKTIELVLGVDVPDRVAEEIRKNGIIPVADGAIGIQSKLSNKTYWIKISRATVLEKK
jgi:hypothetical protein